MRDGAAAAGVVAFTDGAGAGGAPPAILLGPWAAMLVMTAVLGVQALVFQDDGIAPLGANLFNLAVLGVLSGYAVFWLGVRLIGARRPVV